MENRVLPISMGPRQSIFSRTIREYGVSFEGYIIEAGHKYPINVKQSDEWVTRSRIQTLTKKQVSHQQDK